MNLPEVVFYFLLSLLIVPSVILAGYYVIVIEEVDVINWSLNHSLELFCGIVSVVFIISIIRSTSAKEILILMIKLVALLFVLFLLLKILSSVNKQKVKIVDDQSLIADINLLKNPGEELIKNRRSAEQRIASGVYFMVFHEMESIVLDTIYSATSWITPTLIQIFVIVLLLSAVYFFQAVSSNYMNGMMWKNALLQNQQNANQPHLLSRQFSRPRVLYITQGGGSSSSSGKRSSSRKRRSRTMDQGEYESGDDERGHHGPKIVEVE